MVATTHIWSSYERINARWIAIAVFVYAIWCKFHTQEKLPSIHVTSGHLADFQHF